MESIYILIPISIVLVLLIGIALWWSSKSGQFDDLEGPGHRIIMDDDDTEHLRLGSLKHKENQHNE